MDHQYNSEDDNAYSEHLLKKCPTLNTLDSKCFLYQSFSYNEALTFETVLKRLNEQWSWSGIEKNVNITWEIIKDHRSLRDWNFNYISCNPNITWEIVRDNENENWDYRSMASYNPNITPDIIEDFPQYNWNWAFLHNNKNLTTEFIENNIDKPWDFYDLSLHPGITMDLILRHPDKGWVQYQVADNPVISWDDIQNNPDFFGTDMSTYSETPNVPWDTYYKFYPYFERNVLHFYTHLTIENVVYGADPDNKIDQEFTAFEYSINKNFQKWDLIDYMITSSYDGPVKENSTYDKFCDKVAYEALRGTMNSFEEVNFRAFFDEYEISHCKDTTWIEIEKYATDHDRWSFNAIASNHMPRYKELFLEGKVQTC